MLSQFALFDRNNMAAKAYINTLLIENCVPRPRWMIVGFVERFLRKY